MRYIGGKRLILQAIEQIILSQCPSVGSVMDLFAGSCICARRFKELGWKVTANDSLYFSYVLARGSVGLNSMPRFCEGDALEAIDMLNALDMDSSQHSEEELFIFNNYSPANGCDRMYFQPDNARKIDLMRLQIEDWRSCGAIDDDGYFYLLACLLEAVPFVANITGTYAAYLKFWERRSYKPIELKPIEIADNRQHNRCFNLDYAEALGLAEADLVYADPPYNSREYLPNYHILETIARYDHPVIHGVTGVREYSEEKSPFCKKAQVKGAFEKLLAQCRSRYLLISYSTDGLISIDDLVQICEKDSVSIQITGQSYRKYQSKIASSKRELKEELILVERSV